MLRQIVTPGEFLAAFVALEGLVVRVERAIVAFQVLLSAEAARTQRADKRLGRIIGQGLLASATSYRSCCVGSSSAAGLR